MEESPCKHCCGEITKNEIGEEGCFCELTDNWESITLGDCIKNCECEEKN